AKPEPGQTKNYNLTVSSSGSRKFLDVMEVRVFVETDDLYPGRPDEYWSSYTETFAANSDSSKPALTRWWTVQEHINTSASTTGMKVFAEFLDDPRRDGWALAYRASGTAPWSFVSSSTASAGVTDVTLTGLTQGQIYEVGFGSTASGTLYYDTVKTVRVPYLTDNITHQQPVTLRNVFSTVYDYLLATFLATQAFSNSLVSVLDYTYVINSIRGSDVAHVDISSAIAPLRRSFTTDGNTTSTSTPFAVHTFVYSDNDPPEGIGLTISGLIGGDTLYSDDYYTVTPSATDNRAVQKFDIYLKDMSTGEEEYIGTTYSGTFDFYVSEELENGDYKLGMTAVDFRGNTSEMYHTSEFEVISNP
ncbi:MAG: hypothetical protein Q7T74_07425, partial [Candidatus Saccharibacteria bacterium]|nr:hypothetical protein [Candidatus Saccharibacteria bacterium]